MFSALFIVLLSLVMGAIPALIFIFLLRKRLLGLAKGFLLILVVLSAAGAVNLTYGMGAGFFGGFLSCLVIPAAAVSLVLLIAARRYLAYSPDEPRYRLHVAGAILIPLLVFAPMLGELAIIGACNAWTRDVGNTIVEALEAYRQDHGAYPPGLEALVSDYMAAIPSAHCFAPYQWFQGADFSAVDKAQFTLRECPDGEATLLTVSSLELDFILRHNLTTGRWSRVSFLDGQCSHLR